MCEFAYMKFFPGDFLADTLDLDRADIGSYMLLIMALWRHDGELQNDVQLLSRTCRVRRDWPKVWDRLKRFFVISEDGQTISQKRVTAGSDAARKRVLARTKGAEQRAQSVYSKSRKPLKTNDATSQDSVYARAYPVPESEEKKEKPSQAFPSVSVLDHPAREPEPREAPFDGRSRSAADGPPRDYVRPPDWTRLPLPECIQRLKGTPAWFDAAAKFNRNGTLPEGATP